MVAISYDFLMLQHLAKKHVSLRRFNVLHCSPDIQLEISHRG